MRIEYAHAYGDQPSRIAVPLMGAVDDCLEALQSELCATPHDIDAAKHIYDTIHATGMSAWGLDRPT